MRLAKAAMDRISFFILVQTGFYFGFNHDAIQPILNNTTDR